VGQGGDAYRETCSTLAVRLGDDDQIAAAFGMQWRVNGLRNAPTASTMAASAGLDMNPTITSTMTAVLRSLSAQMLSK